MADASYDEIRQNLRLSYDGSASRRDQMVKHGWKLAERTAFLRRLQQENGTRLLEIGAGTGQDSAFFAGNGLTVTATDLSAEMVARCRQKGLDALVMDFSRLEFPDAAFDAVHAMNCLLHVPNADLPAVLAEIARVLRPGGLFFLGVYGGSEGEGPADADDHVPARFFSWRTDQQILQFASRQFEVIDFHVAESGTDHRFQSLTLRRPAGRETPRAAGVARRGREMAFRTSRSDVRRQADMPVTAPPRLRRFSCPECGLSVRDKTAARLGYCASCQEFTGMCGAGRRVICPDVMSVTSWHTPCTHLGVSAWQVTLSDGPCIVRLCPVHDSEVRAKSVPWSIEAIPVSSILRFRRPRAS